MTLRRTLAAIAVAAAAAAAPAPSRAETKSDAFAGRIPPISGQLYAKKGRFEVGLAGNLSITDAFFTKYFGGVSAGYHFFESLSASLQLATGRSVNSGSAVLCSRTSGCGDAKDEMLFQVPGRIQAIYGAELAWAPVYGKLNVVAEKVAHFDLSILLGADLIAHDRVLSGRTPTTGGPSEAAALAASGGKPTVENAVGGHVGIGARVFLAEWLAARVAVKNYVYAVKVPNAGVGKDVQNQLFTEVGLSFFLPTHNRSSR